MGMVTSVTFTYTVIHGILFILAKGWNTTNTVVDRNQATNLTLVLGVMYLVYSAKFLSSNYTGINEFINGVLALLYFILGVVNVGSVTEQINLLKQLMAHAEDAIPVGFMLSLKMKHSMLKQFRIVLLMFFIPKFILYVSNVYNNGDEFRYYENETNV
jgi:hypothetical protein